MCLEPSKPKLKSRIKSRLNMKGLSNSLTGRFAGWFRKRRQRSKEGKPTESRSIRYLAFILTLVSMMLILTLVPFFPQPLPLLIAVLIAFMTLINPMIGMSVGSVPVALGLLYHISNLNFIAGLGNAEVRVFVIALVMFFFVMLPIRFRRYEDAVAINIGIIAASTLFFDQTYFLAIPLLLTAATVYKRTQIGLSVAYYALISVPLMLEQYYQLVLTIPRSDFWNDPGAVPPFFGSLNGLISQIQVTMPRFRMFDATQSLKTISGQIFATPPVTVHTVVEAINQYIDSFPGIVLFLVIFGGTVWAAGFILSSLSKGSVGKAERLFPIIAASGITALFFLLASVLHKALAFSISIDSTMMATGVLAAALFGVPVAVANYAPRRKVEIEKRSMIVMEKAQSQLTKLKVVEDLLEKAKSTLPINVRSVDGKKTVTKDKLEEILTKTSARLYKLAELRQEDS